MSPEAEILHDLLEQAERSAKGLKASIAAIGSFPADEATFDAMPPMQEIATTAMLKQVEQFEGSLHGAFRVVLKLLGLPLRGLYPLDIGNRMAQLGVLSDGEVWLAAVKLRNELVHEYPFDLKSRFDRTAQAFAVVPTLHDALIRLREVVVERKWLEL